MAPPQTEGRRGFWTTRGQGVAAEIRHSVATGTKPRTLWGSRSSESDGVFKNHSRRKFWVQRNCPCCSVIADLFHQSAHELASALFKCVPVGLQNVELFPCFLDAQSCPKLFEHRIFNHPRRHRSSGHELQPFCRPSGIRNSDSAAPVWRYRWEPSAVGSFGKTADRRVEMVCRGPALALSRVNTESRPKR